jgi:hypothetical protein
MSNYNRRVHQAAFMKLPVPFARRARNISEIISKLSRLLTAGWKVYDSAS